MKSDNLVWSITAGLCVLCCLLIMPAGAAPPQETSAAALPFISGPPLTLEALAKMIGGVSEDLIGESTVLEAIEKRGLDFDAQPANFERLRTVGASERVLEAVRAKAKPATPQPSTPPQRTTGTLSVSCVPAECSIAVRGQPKGETRNGLLTIGEIAPGKVFVDVKKAGYIGQQQTTVIEPGVETRLAVTLEPARETRLRLGGEFLQSMRKAIGDLRDLTVAGAASAVDENGKLSEWNVGLVSKAGTPRKTRLTANGSYGVVELCCTGERCQDKPGGLFGGKQRKTPQTDSMALHLKLLRTYQLAALAESFSRLTPIAEPDSANGERHLKLESSDESYQVTLNSDWLPTTVRYSSQVGVLSGLEVIYAGYAQLGKARYPGRTSIKLPKSSQAIVVKLDRLDATATIRDKDFPK